MKQTLLSISAAALLITGCASTVTTGGTNMSAHSRPISNNTLALTKQEQLQLADEMVDAMLLAVQQGRIFSNPKSKYVLAIGSLDNQTTNIRELNSFEDRVKEKLQEGVPNLTINDTIRADGNVDIMQDAMDEIRGNAKYDQSKVAKIGGLQGYSQILRTYLKNDYVPLNGNKVEVTYELNMRINDAYTGTTMWSKTTYITKQGSRKDLKW